MTIQDLLLLAAALTCAAAARYGSAPERLLSAAFLANLLLEEACAALIGREYATERSSSVYFALEFGLLFMVCVLALRANRVYPLWLGGAQIIAVSAHVLLQVRGPEIMAACQLIDACASLVGLIALITGLSCHRLWQLRLGRSYPDWTARADLR